VAKKKLHRIRVGGLGDQRSVVIVFGDGGGIAGAKDFCLFADSNERLIETVSVAVGAEQCFFQNNTPTPFADFVVGWVSEDFGGSTRARIRVGHLWKTTACEEFGKSFAIAERGGRVGGCQEKQVGSRNCGREWTLAVGTSGTLRISRDSIGRSITRLTMSWSRSGWSGGAKPRGHYFIKA
jgi:hypothetical protein